MELLVLVFSVVASASAALAWAERERRQAAETGAVQVRAQVADLEQRLRRVLAENCAIEIQRAADGVEPNWQARDEQARIRHLHAVDSD